MNRQVQSETTSEWRRCTNGRSFRCAPSLLSKAGSPLGLPPPPSPSPYHHSPWPSSSSYPSTFSCVRDLAVKFACTQLHWLYFPALCSSPCSRSASYSLTLHPDHPRPQITALATGPSEPGSSKDVLFVGSQTDLLACVHQVISLIHAQTCPRPCCIIRLL